MVRVTLGEGKSRFIEFKGDDDAWTVLGSFRRTSCPDVGLLARRHGSGHQRQELPDGAAMPLAGFQENLRLGESLPMIVICSDVSSML
jgi:hypothetical protein